VVLIGFAQANVSGQKFAGIFKIAQGLGSLHQHVRARGG
jgi:hypothetical protein